MYRIATANKCRPEAAVFVTVSGVLVTSIEVYVIVTIWDTVYSEIQRKDGKRVVVSVAGRQEKVVPERLGQQVIAADNCPAAAVYCEGHAEAMYVAVSSHDDGRQVGTWEGPPRTVG